MSQRPVSNACRLVSWHIQRATPACRGLVVPHEGVLVAPYIRSMLLIAPEGGSVVLKVHIVMFQHVQCVYEQRWQFYDIEQRSELW
jgi:hypothetical protein